MTDHVNTNDLRLSLEIALADADYWQQAARSNLVQRYKRERDNTRQDLREALIDLGAAKSEIDRLRGELDRQDAQLCELAARAS